MSLLFVIESGGKTFVSYEYLTVTAWHAGVKRVQTSVYPATGQLSRLCSNILHSKATTKL